MKGTTLLFHCTRTLDFPSQLEVWINTAANLIAATDRTELSPEGLPINQVRTESWYISEYRRVARQYGLPIPKSCQQVMDQMSCLWVYQD
jgi:hypothetical protein